MEHSPQKGGLPQGSKNKNICKMLDPLNNDPWLVNNAVNSLHSTFLISQKQYHELPVSQTKGTL